MLSKSSIILPSHTAMFFMALLLAGCFSIWFLNGFPEITITFSRNLENSRYLLILSRNNSAVNQPHFINELPINDKSTLIDIKNFKFTMNHITCSTTEPLLLLLIHSAPANLNKRNLIRETWGQQISSITTFFLLGSSEKFKTKLENEDTEFKDLIQGNFIDAYRNMTYKHVMALKWVTYYCPSARYILKLDDDVFVHVSALLEYLKRELLPRGSQRLLLCDAISTSKVKRTWRSKWHVSPKEYPGIEYPSYCAGWAILYSADTVFPLYRDAQKEPFFWIDDVHITGTLVKKNNLTQISMHSMILSDYAMKILLSKLIIRKKFFFGPPNLQENKIRALHNAVSTNVKI